MTDPGSDESICQQCVALDRQIAELNGTLHTQHAEVQRLTLAAANLDARLMQETQSSSTAPFDYTVYEQHWRDTEAEWERHS